MNKLLAFKTLGIRGALKTLWHSSRHTGTWNRIVLHPNVLTSLSPDATYDIQGRFMVGVHERGATHPKLHASKFTVNAGAVIRHTGIQGAAIGPGTVLHVEGEFAIGDSYINSDARIICGDRITIGDDCAIAWDVTLIDDDRHQHSVHDEPRPQTKPITIGDGVWIAHGASVQKGVTIGDGAIVGSNATVTDNVPANALVAGTPACVIEDDISWN